MEKNHISEVRSFNRFYTALIGVLNKKFLNGKYSLPELRVLQAIHVQEGITASEIIVLLNMDKSYLSRIILRFEKNRFITKKIVPEDGRSSHLYLTASGKKEFIKQDAATHNQVKELLSKLSDNDCKILIGSMASIKEILSKPGAEKK